MGDSMQREACRWTFLKLIPNRLPYIHIHPRSRDIDTMNHRNPRWLAALQRRQQPPSKLKKSGGARLHPGESDGGGGQRVEAIAADGGGRSTFADDDGRKRMNELLPRGA